MPEYPVLISPPLAGGDEGEGRVIHLTLILLLSAGFIVKSFLLSVKTRFVNQFQ